MDRGRALTEEVLERARAAGNLRMEAQALAGLGFHAREEGRFEDALSLNAASYLISDDLGAREEIADAISRSARVHAAAGSPMTAVQLPSSSNAYFDDLGVSPAPWVADRNEATLALVRGQLDKAAFAKAWDEGRTLSADEAIALGLEETESNA
jgi:hypothetical protein